MYARHMNHKCPKGRAGGKINQNLIFNEAVPWH